MSSAPPTDAIPATGLPDHIEAWVFDLDNTLYPAHCDLFAQVDQRMGEFIARFLGVDAVEAKRLQKAYYHEYGTTLSGLMQLHGMDPGPFLDYVHDIDLDLVPADAALRQALLALDGPKYVFTNGSVRHAENVLARIGIADAFDDIFDIAAADYVPKPHRATYDRFLARTNIRSEGAAMFEDIMRNLEQPHAMGMTTVLVRSASHQGFGPPGEGAQVEAYVHHVTEDLAEFLAAVPARSSGSSAAASR